MTWKNRYNPEPLNAPPGMLTRNDVQQIVLDNLNSSSSYGSYASQSIPQLAIRRGVVDNLPAAPEVNQEAYLTVDATTHAVAHMLYLSSGWVQIGNPPIVTALPTSVAVQGMQVVYDTGTAGVRWHLTYDTSDGTTYPWLFIGGSPLIAQADPSPAETTTSTSYTNLTTTGPSITLALAGSYHISARVYASNATANVIQFMSYAVGSTAASDTDAAYSISTTSIGTVQTEQTRLKTAAAGDVVTAKYKTGSSTASFERRTLIITPVRVG